jgi:ATP-dependent DNA ligase
MLQIGLVIAHTEGDGEKKFESVCKLGPEGSVSKRATSISGPPKTWIIVKEKAVGAWGDQRLSEGGQG